ncbi:hypothetical protein EBU95_15940 [bacterium]|nr:hypothetical protein [bacterium]
MNITQKNQILQYTSSDTCYLPSVVNKQYIDKIITVSNNGNFLRQFRPGDLINSLNFLEAGETYLVVSNTVPYTIVAPDVFPTPTPSPTPSATPIPPTPTPTPSPTNIPYQLDKFLFVAQGSNLAQAPFEIFEYTNNLSTLSKITVNPNFNTNTQVAVAYEKGVNSNLVAVVTDLNVPTRIVKRWNGTSWDTISTPATLAPSVAYSSNGADVLFIDSNNKYYYYHYNSSGSSMNFCSSNDRGVTWSTATQMSPGAVNARDIFDAGNQIISAQSKISNSVHQVVYPTTGGLFAYAGTYTGTPLLATVPAQYDYNCDFSGNFNLASVRIQGGNGVIYYNETVVYNNANTTTDYTTDPLGNHWNVRTTRISLDYDRNNTNICYIAYLKKSSTFYRGGVGVIEYNSNTNSIISNTFVASVQAIGGGLFNFTPNLASDIQSFKLVVNSDNTLSLFVETFEGSPNFRMSMHIFKRNASGTWSYSSGPIYTAVPNDLSYAQYALRHIAD